MHNSQALARRNFAIRRRVRCAASMSKGPEASWSKSSRTLPRRSSRVDAAEPSRSVFMGRPYRDIRRLPCFHRKIAALPGSPCGAGIQSRSRALPPAALTPASVLDVVRTVFGLNISETAEVFGITRQTAYQWMKLTDMEQVRAHENRDRLKQLYCAAQSWQNLSPLKGRWLYALLPSGNTVLDLLRAPQIDLIALQSAYQAVAASTQERRREEGERATRAVQHAGESLSDIGAGRKARKGAR